MTTHRLIAVGVLFPVLMSGCGGKVKSWDFPAVEKDPAPNAAAAPGATGLKKTGGPAAKEAQEPARQGDRMDAHAGTADALAVKAESYSRELAAIMQSRRGSPQPPSLPSQVQWIDTPFPASTDLRLSAGSEPQARPAAAVQEPSIAATDSGPGAANTDPASLRVPPPGAPVKPGETGSMNSSPIALADASAKAGSLPGPIASNDPIIQRAEARLKESPRDIWLHTEYQFLRLVREEPTPEMSVLSSLPQEDRELVTALVDGFANFRSGLRQDSNMLLSSKIRPIVDMADRLRQQAELTIPALVLCTKVDKFGVYDPIEPARFPADRDNQAIVYVEVANFMSTLTGGQTWQSQFKWDMTLYTEQAVPVWSQKTQEVEDSSRTKRRDFFMRTLITLPRTLPVGRYLLKVTIIDKQSNHVSEATAPLVIAAQ